MKQTFFYGIKPYEFIYNGDWADPEILYNNRFYNYYTVETFVYECFLDDLRGIGINTDGVKDSVLDDMFKNNYIEEHSYLIGECISSLDECGDFREMKIVDVE